MNPEIKTKWLEALRSGAYKQGRNVLRRGDTYCCLGVLCEVMGIVGEATDFGNYAYDGGELTALNATRLGEAGLDQDEQGELIAMNDSIGSSFFEIANYIEAHL